MSGICGWLGSTTADPQLVIRGMADALARRDDWAMHSSTGPGFGLAVAGPPAAVGWYTSPTLHVAFHGHPFWLRDHAATGAHATLADAIAAEYRAHGIGIVARLGGDFALGIVDLAHERVCLAIDRIGIRNLVYRSFADAFVFGATLDALAAFPGPRAKLVAQSIYDYVHFHVVPGPGTVFHEVERMMPGSHLEAEPGGRKRVATYWQIRFDEPGMPASEALRERLRQTLREGVAAFAPASHEGAFLSGGTDSSTVCGMLTGVLGRPAASYSIGFPAQAYDEMEYAQIAARHFATDHHEHYVSPAEVVEALPTLAGEFDQPFGNASAIPTFLCARLARGDGVERMLAGDGGDELFGGNARYAKQAQLAHYHRLPRMIRATFEALTARAPASRLALLRKARSYVEQARLPMPARYETYNLLERLGARNVFTPEFLARVDTGRPLALLVECHGRSGARALVNQMLAIDLRFTLFDSDLPKVTRMCDRAGVDVAFPLLHDATIELSAKLAPRLKLAGPRLRPFFKDSLRAFLPAPTIAKRKHGFGLPAGPWLADHPPLNALMREAMASLGKRGIVRPEFLSELVERRLAEHSAYYGTMLWVLMMLELWLERQPAAVAASWRE